MNNTFKVLFLLLILNLWCATQVVANEVNVVSAKFTQNDQGNWNINVTLRHADKDWKHYANAWRVVDEQGNVIAERILGHPHVNEQPFTRGLNNVSIPKEKQLVFIEAHDLVHGWTPNRLKVDMDDVVDGRLTITP